MTEKELKKLNRYQLLELIIMQSEELESVKAQLQQAQHQLEQRNIDIKEAGNIAQAALQLSGIFEAAQAAADMYIENVKLNSEKCLQQQNKEAEAELCDELHQINEASEPLKE